MVGLHTSVCFFVFFVSIAHYVIYYLFNYGFFSSFLRIFIGGKMKRLFINRYEHKAFISLFSAPLLYMRLQLQWRDWS